LEVEGIQELLSALSADLSKGLSHGKRRPRVLGHGVGQDLRVSAVDGVDIGLISGAGREKTFAGHE
jgi:hypothetical protein